MRWPLFAELRDARTNTVHRARQLPESVYKITACAVVVVPHYDWTEAYPPTGYDMCPACATAAAAGPAERRSGQ